MSPFYLCCFFLALFLGYGDARSSQHYETENNPNSVEALKKVIQTSYDAPSRWMMLKRDLLNITIDTDKIDDEPLTASDLLLRAKLMAYTQKLVDKEAKKKAKEVKKAEKAKLKAALLGLPPNLMALPPPVTVSPPLPIPTSVNLTGSEPLPPTGFWLYKKASFLAKLFNALAEAAATLPDVTTEALPPAEPTEMKMTTPSLVSDDDENEEDETSDATIVNVNDKRSVEEEGYGSDEDKDDDFDAEFNERVYIEAPATKMVKYTRKNSKPYKHYGVSKKLKEEHHKKPFHHKFRSHSREE